MAAYRKKLIEVALPLEAINREAVREKSIRHGHPSTLHLWWARRPLAACRAVLFGQLVDDPSAWPERFPTEQAQSAERDRLHKLIERLVPWEASNNEAILNEARWEIARSIGWNRGEEPPGKDDPAAVFDYLQTKAPPVYDPFCGGGSIPLEAQRLGLRAYGSDLNPVAVLITKALVEIPPKFAGLPPVNPESRAEIARGGRWQGKGAQGLAADVRYYGRRLRDRAYEQLRELYPPVGLPPEFGGESCPAIAWIWARAVPSSNPSLRDVYVPLIRSFALSSKGPRKFWVEANFDEGDRCVRFKVKSGPTPTTGGTIDSKGARCVISGAPLSFSYIRNQAAEGRMRSVLLAIAADTKKFGRVYVSPPEKLTDLPHIPAALVEQTSLPKGGLGFRVQNYGLTRHRDLYTDRQLKTFSIFIDQFPKVLDEVKLDCFDTSVDEVNEYERAIASYLGLTISKAARYWTTLSFWRNDDGKLSRAFGRQTVSMTWDFAETNPFGDAGGDFLGLIEGTATVVETLPTTQGKIWQHDARSNFSVDKIIISTDPPYYDNVGYADLSDFFYIWLRKCLRPYYPELFATILTPKSGELIVDVDRHSSKQKAIGFFENGLFNAVSHIVPASLAEFPSTVYYAYKQAENKEIKSGEVAYASTGWATFLNSIVYSGLQITGTMPVHTEGKTRMRAMNSNALASSVVLACRDRLSDAPITARATFLRELRSELPRSLKLLQAGSVAPVDLTQAAIGPGMAIFSRYAKVLNVDDTSTSVMTALQDINAALDAFLSEQESEYDAYTRFAITWFEQAGMAPGPYGTAETLATARGISVGGVREAGIVESGGGKVRLKRREEMNGAAGGTVWGSTQHLIHRLMDGSEEAAAEAIAGLGHRAEAAKDLAYRLYGICERKKWAAEGLAYNALVASWPRLIEQGKKFTAGPAQPSLGL